MLSIKAENKRQYGYNSRKIDVEPNKNYKVTTEVTGKSGESFSAYFGVVILDKNGIEMDRKIRWLNDFSGVPKKESIVFKAKNNKIILIYRINDRTTPLKSNCEFLVLEPDRIEINGVEEEEKFDDLKNFVLDRSKRLTEEEEFDLEKNLIWIFGSSRSGTTWLGRELLSFETLFMNEPSLVDHLVTIHTSEGNNVIRRIDHHKNRDNYFFSEKFEKVWKTYLRKLILQRIFAQFRTTNKKIIVKEPSGSLNASDIIFKCLPNSKYIFLLRDGRDVIDSIVDGRQKDGWMTKTDNSQSLEIDQRGNFIKRHAKLWINLIQGLESTFDELPPENRFIVKYEDLRTNPLENLEKIYKFIGIEINKDKLERIVDRYTFEKIPKEMRGKGKFARSASPGKWKDNFNEKEIQLMNEIMGETLKRVGY